MSESCEDRRTRSLSSASAYSRNGVHDVADRPTSLGRRTSPPFSVHASAARFASRPQNTRYDNVSGHYVIPWHPSGPPLHHAYHPLEPYPTTRYFPLQPHPPPYFQPSVQGADPPYQSGAHVPPPVSQLATIHPAPPNAPPFSGVQQYPPLYTLHVQPTAYPSYYGPGPSVQTPFINSQVQQHYPINYPQPRIHSARRNSQALSVQSTSSDALSSSPSVAPSTESTAVTASRDTVSSFASDPPKQFILASTTAAHDQPSVRRPYHPKSPPSRSEWVMWMGNIPSDATHDELWRFLNHSGPRSFGGEVTSEVEDNGAMSLFLISRSKCAFVNYQSEEQLNHAISQFDGRKLRPHDRRCPRLVCRVRRKEDDLRAGVGAQRGMGVHRRHVKGMLQKNRTSKAPRSAPSTNEPQPPKSNDGTPRSDVMDGANHKVSLQSPSSYASTSSSFLSRHFPKRFFILKSLTRYDLDLSAERGVWATQKHNETTLDQAFRTSVEVILIFSVNKSGEFYGYARMTSGISRDNHNVSWAPRAESLSSTSSPSTRRVLNQSLPQRHPNSPYPGQLHTTPSKLFSEVFRAPPANSSDENGASQSETNSLSIHSLEQQSTPRLLDPSSSSIISDLGNSDQRLPPVMEDMYSESGVEEIQSCTSATRSQSREANWGAPFRIEWLCTDRVQFHRTRHLRNPWNHGREVKVSRDGTELEPSVGQQLVDSWSGLSGEPTRRNNAMRATGSAPKPSPSE